MLSCSIGYGADARVVIADGAKTKTEAEQKLTQLKLASSVRLAPGYPRVLPSESMKGLNPGLHIVVLGLCSSADRAPIKSNGVGMNIALKHHTHLLKQLKASVRGVYSKTVTTDLPLSCPLFLFSEPVPTTGELHRAWATLQKNATSADAWVAFGKLLEDEGDLDDADYAYSTALEHDSGSTVAQDALYRLDFVGARSP